MNEFSRRGFLKGAAVTTGAAAITSVTPLPAFAAKGKNSPILTAAHWGAMQVKTKMGLLFHQKGH